jgi:hypothetical protein
MATCSRTHEEAGENRKLQGRLLGVNGREQNCAAKFVRSGRKYD